MIVKSKIRRYRWHRILFCFAGAYNILWGIYVAYDPQWLFRFSGMPLSSNPEIFACLGMVIGLYGLLYFEVARMPENGWAIATVGLLGKLLGPIGAISLIMQCKWPASAFILCITNDIIWWVPFGLYLYDSWKLKKEY